MLLSKKMKKNIYFCQCHTENDDECPLFYYHKHGDTLMHYQLLSPALRMYTYIQLKIQLTKL